MRELAAKHAWADADCDLAWTVAVIQGSRRSGRWPLAATSTAHGAGRSVSDTPTDVP